LIIFFDVISENYIKSAAIERIVRWFNGQIVIELAI